MEISFLVALALLMLLLAAYAQARIAFFTKPGPRVMIVRLLLIVVGVSFGMIGSRGYEGTLQLLAFLIGFGLVHVPAAVILFIKGKRGATKS